MKINKAGYKILTPLDRDTILKNIEIPPPVHIYDIIVKNIANTGVDVIATRDAGY